MSIKHIALIMDGNGRWAKKRGLSRIEGHRKGVMRVNEMIDAAIDHKLKAITFYTFSMENWQRPAEEVNALMNILSSFIKSEMRKLSDKNIVFRAVGNIEKLPKGVLELVREFEDFTKDNTGVIVTSALSYGGRAEILHAIRQLIQNGIRPEAVDEKMLEAHLYTVGIPDPDLIIRTSGELRLSNFLLWQSAYSEFYFTRTLWPDFDSEEFASAIEEYESRERRFGALPEEG